MHAAEEKFHYEWLYNIIITMLYIVLIHVICIISYILFNIVTMRHHILTMKICEHYNHDVAKPQACSCPKALVAFT